MKYILLCLISFSAYSQSIIPKEFSAQYEESITSAVTGKELKSLGNITYRYPSHLRLEVTDPEPSTVVVNPKQTWIYQPPFIEGEKGQVTIEKKSSWPLLKTFDSLAKSLEGSKDFTHKFDDSKLIITFSKPMMDVVGLKNVIFQSKGSAKLVKTLGEFESMIITKVDGKEQRYKFKEIKTTAVDVINFTFDVPANTKIIKN